MIINISFLILKKKQERPVDVLANIDQQRADLLPNQGNEKNEECLYYSYVFCF
jgi:hypothetical protein